MSYIILGFIAGLVGLSLDRTSNAVGVQDLLALALGSWMIFLGARGLWSGNLNLHLAGSSKLARVLSTPVRAVLTVSGTVDQPTRALLLGLMTSILPCGWLYTYLAVAAATASPVRGALSMAVFWLGTLPIMLSLGAAMSNISARTTRILPRLTAAIIMLAGVFALTSHLGYWPNSREAGQPCHTEAVSPLEAVSR